MVRIIIAGTKAGGGFPAEVASPFSRPKATKATSEMSYFGLLLDVSQWPLRHPGGQGMIKGHMGEDISMLFENFHGGWPAPLATLFGLQCGTVKVAVGVEGGPGSATAVRGGEEAAADGAKKLILPAAAGQGATSDEGLQEGANQLRAQQVLPDAVVRAWVAA